jgi:hypothetical protein
LTRQQGTRDQSSSNDPLDVAPVIALGGDPNDPKFVAELEAKEREFHRAKGMRDADIQEYRKANGTSIESLAARTIGA